MTPINLTTQFLRLKNGIGRAKSARLSTNKSNYNLDLVKKRDYEHFLTNLLLPPSIRPASFVIRAFNCEISSICDSVTNPHTGLIRMQFWKDILTDIYRGNLDAKEPKPIKAHPVAIGLFHIINRHKLPEELFLRMIDSREIFLTKGRFLNLSQVDEYTKNAFSSVYYLLLHCLHENEIPGHARHAATQLGQSEGLITLLRSVPYVSAKDKQVYLPMDLLHTHKVSAESIIRGKPDAEFGHIVEVIAARAEEHLNNFNFRHKYLTRNEKLIFLSSVICDDYLSRLSKAKCDVFNPEINKRNHFLPISLFLHKLKQR